MTEQSAAAQIDVVAQQLDRAWETRRPIAPLTEGSSITTVDQAYAVQQRWSALRAAREERIVGRKIGLTSAAIQQQLGVDEPDYGCLWSSRHFPTSGGRVEVPADLFVQPRLEGELAFLIGSPLRGPHVTPEQVLAATEALAVAVEIVDSRITDWKIKLIDTVADNASFGGFAVGAWSQALRRVDLRTLGLRIRRNGAQIIQAVGAASLGDPALAVAWLANKLSRFGTELRPGDIVLSGSLGGLTPFERGDTFVVELDGRPPLVVAIV